MLDDDYSAEDAIYPTALYRQEFCTVQYARPLNTSPENRTAEEEDKSQDSELQALFKCYYKLPIELGCVLADLRYLLPYTSNDWSYNFIFSIFWLSCLGDKPRHFFSPARWRAHQVGLFVDIIMGFLISKTTRKKVVVQFFEQLSKDYRMVQ